MSIRSVDAATLDELRKTLRAFAAERDWERFHTSKNLSMALAAEAGELLELFQWLTEDEASRVAESPAKLKRVREECADVLIHLVRLADVVGFDLLSAAADKVRDNGRRYPPDSSRKSPRTP